MRRATGHGQRVDGWARRRRSFPTAFGAALAATSFLALTTTACSSDDPTSSTVGPRLVACAAEPDRPLVWLDHTTHRPDGFTWDLVAEIVERADGTLRLRRSRLDDLTFDLLDGDCDLIVSTLLDTPEVSEQIATSEPYLPADLALGVRKNDAATFPTIASLGGRRLGIVEGSAADTWLTANLPGGAEVRRYPATGDIVAALRSGDVDGVVAGAAALRHRAAVESSVTVTEIVPTGVGLVIGVHPDDGDLLALVDDGLEDLRDDGTFDEISEEWFGAPDGP